jgi:hypothetical protein
MSTVDDYLRVLKMAFDEYSSPVKELLVHYYHDGVVPTRQYFGGIQVRNDSWQALYFGLFLGVITLAYLIANPGEPYDYETSEAIKGTEGDDSVATNKEKVSKSKKSKKTGKDKKKNDSIADNTLQSTKEEGISKRKINDSGNHVDVEATSFLKGLMNVGEHISSTNSKSVEEATNMLLGAPSSSAATAASQRKTKKSGLKSNNEKNNKQSTSDECLDNELKDSEPSSKNKKRKNRKTTSGDANEVVVSSPTTYKEKADNESGGEEETESSAGPRDPFSDPIVMETLSLVDPPVFGCLFFHIYNSLC